MQLKDQDCGSGYIMSSLNNSTDDTKQHQFSNCSISAIRDKLEMLLSDDDLNCIKEDDETPLELSLCGNGVVEPGEECDCGDDQLTCDDPCCYPAHIG